MNGGNGEGHVLSPAQQRGKQLACLPEVRRLLPKDIASQIQGRTLAGYENGSSLSLTTTMAAAGGPGKKGQTKLSLGEFLGDSASTGLSGLPSGPDPNRE
jgi:hypothetical protein